ncbi:MAG: DMT family transporter [Pseudomonadota bacterium]|nr:DMT family transporter [Rubrivivax sp.]MCZ8030099.1 DMT family transporter [Rubrivivax sp.]
MADAPRGSLAARLQRHPPAVRGLLWAAAAGAVFSVLNALMRALTMQLDPMQSQFLRYLFGLVVLLPLVWRHGWAAYRPRQVGGQFARGLLHTVGLVLWFLALPRIPLADMTAIGFTGPIFIMLGAWIFFREPMRWERWLAVVLGFAGVMIVVGPKLGGSGGWWHLVMLASAPVFAASFLLTKALTRTETTGTILVWQALTVTLFSLPLALPVWGPVSAWQWAGFVASGALGSLGHYCLTRSFAAADISATQSAKFLDLVWAALLGWLVFADVPTQSTLLGGALICAATLWVARREAHAGGLR